MSDINGSFKSTFVKKRTRLLGWIVGVLAVVSVVFALVDASLKPQGTVTRSGNECLLEKNQEFLQGYWQTPQAHLNAAHYLDRRAVIGSNRFFDSVLRRSRLVYALSIRRQRLESVFCQVASVPIRNGAQQLEMELPLISFSRQVGQDFDVSFDAELYSVCLALNDRPVLVHSDYRYETVRACVEQARQWSNEIDGELRRTVPHSSVRD